MRFLILFIFLFSKTYSQKLEIKNVDTFIGVDIYENIYYLKNNSIYKKGIQSEYLNIKYGKPNCVDISNPLQIVVFYKLFNTVILLDNQLNFISEFKVPFGTELIANAGKNKIWMYNSMNMILSIYNFRNSQTEVKSIPITNTVTTLKGNLNKALITTENNRLITYSFLARVSKNIDISKKNYSINLKDNIYITNNTLYNNSKALLKNIKYIKYYETTPNYFYYLKSNNIYSITFPKN